MSNGGERGQGNFLLEIAAVPRRSSACGLETTGEPSKPFWGLSPVRGTPSTFLDVFCFFLRRSPFQPPFDLHSLGFCLEGFLKNHFHREALLRINGTPSRVVSLKTIIRMLRNACVVGVVGTQKQVNIPSVAHYMAEREGFEPSKPFWGLHDFQSCAFDHSAISPHPDSKYKRGTEPNSRNPFGFIPRTGDASLGHLSVKSSPP